MIKIGDFARLGQVSVVTLRHYDEVGLLKPVSVDNFTGYRYYAVAQLSELNHILALKDLGFSLDQIAQVLQGLTGEQLQGMLIMKQVEVQQHLVDEQARLSRIGVRLKQLKMEDTMPNYDVVLKTVPPQLIASRKVSIPTNDQVPAYLNEAYGEVYSHIKAQGAKDTGACFGVWHQPAAILANEVAEAAVPVDHAIPSSDRVKVYELPQAQVASAVHRGEFVSFVQLHAVLLDWIESNNYQIVGPYREIYINSADKSNSTTEIQYPVAKAN
ncbi:MAG: MerR family transcriptional regulator [Anaerolineaceae bacterium]|nr:MerR family transcriptional regulator [Anaerolineaceae bacterium]